MSLISLVVYCCCLHKVALKKIFLKSSNGIEKLVLFEIVCSIFLSITKKQSTLMVLIGYDVPSSP